jgi:YidC/Oxa1 family membrane protein insertase
VNFDISYSVMIPVMQFLAKATNSYGWSIVLLTLLIRIIVWPLVASSTKSMQRMAKLQPMMKELQAKHKDEPEVLAQKMKDFYLENKFNPLGGCLPTLVQLPILIALYATFYGPPFADKDIPVKVTLAKPADAANVKIVQSPTSGATSPFISVDGQRAKFAVQPGDQTLVWGRDLSGQQTNQANTIDFHTLAVSGSPPADFKPSWKIQHDPNGATIDTETGEAFFPAAGEVTVEAGFPNGGAEAAPIDVQIKVEPKPEQQGGFPNVFAGGGEAFRAKIADSEDKRVVQVNGQPVTVVVSPGPSTVMAGSKNVRFEVHPVTGNAPANIPVVWHIVKDSNAATIDANGRAVFPQPGEVIVAATIPGVAKNEPFLFVSSLGKVARGAELMKPQNWDVLGMLIAFAATMYLSSMMMAQPTANMDPEQAAIQKQTQQTMPIAMTIMFFFIALPAGVFIYLVVSNIFQVLQTWLIYKMPSDATEPNIPGGGNQAENGGKISPENSGNGSEPGQKISVPKKKKAQKKKEA